MDTIFLTGANRGLGLEFVRRFIARGDRVLATCREPSAAHELQTLAGRGLRILPLDVADGASIEAAVAQVSDPIDVLINNAGISQPRQRLGDVDYVEWERVLRTNTIGPTHLAQALLPRIAASRRRLVVTITSRMGSIAENEGGYYAYRSSKAAVNMAMSSLAKDAAPLGVTVVVMHPGWVRTELGGPAAPLSVEESVAAMVERIDAFGPTQSGRFINYDGEEIPW